MNYYSFDDLDVKAEEDYFYQIKQLDFNGASTYSEVVHARLKPTISSNVQFYPTPLTVDSKLVFNLENNFYKEMDPFNKEDISWNVIAWRTAKKLPA